MDKEGWAAVDFVVKLDSGLFGFVGVASEASVKKTETGSHAPVADELANWPVDVEEHGSLKSVTDIVEPERVEVRKGSRENGAERPEVL